MTDRDTQTTVPNLRISPLACGSASSGGLSQYSKRRAFLLFILPLPIFQSWGSLGFGRKLSKPARACIRVLYESYCMNCRNYQA